MAMLVIAQRDTGGPARWRATGDASPDLLGEPSVATACSGEWCCALQPAPTRVEVPEVETAGLRRWIDAELHAVGLTQFSEAILQRMELIEVLAVRFNNDSRAIRQMCLEVLDRIAGTLEPALGATLPPDCRRDMSIAAYLHDIGKSGALDAPQGTQEAILKLYAVESVADPNQTIAETVRANFSCPEAESILAHLSSIGLSSAATMRSFWDCHGYWTHEILEADSVHIPARARLVAASHHMDRGIGPCESSSRDYVDRLETRILMAVDKYEAAVVRGRKTHDEAMGLIRAILSPKFREDVVMQRVLDVLDEVGMESPLVAEAA
jgi:hypothetical protein